MKTYTIIVLTPEGEEDQFCFISKKEIAKLKSQGYKILEIEEVDIIMSRTLKLI